MLSDVLGASFRAWDSRDHALRRASDALRRPTHVYVQTGAGAEVLTERTVFGEAHASVDDLNLRGKVYQGYDASGVVTSDGYDFKGNLLSSIRRLATDYTVDPDWGDLDALTDIDDIAAAAEPLLGAEA